METLGTQPEERFWGNAEPGRGATGNFKRGVKLFVDPESPKEPLSHSDELGGGVKYSSQHSPSTPK